MSRSRPLLVLLSAFAVTSPLVAQNPWARVPAFPTNCYLKGDPFPGQLEAALAANSDAIGRQEQTNHGLNDQLKGMDPAVKQNRMMAYMQQNPAGFQTYMRQMAQDPQAPQASAEAHLARMKAFQEEFNTLKAAYAAETKSTLDPVGAEMQRVTDAASKASSAQRAAAISKYNTTYVALCDKWITRENFPGFLAKFKAYMVGDFLPSLDNLTAMEKTTLEMSGISTREYRFTEPLQAVARYMEYAREVYDLRQREPQGD